MNGVYYNMSQPGADGWILPLIPFHFTLVNNVKRDPFEQATGVSQKTAASMQGALGAPATAFNTTGTSCRSASKCGSTGSRRSRSSRRCRLRRATTSRR